VAAPGTLTAWVDSSRQGSVLVYAGGREACGRRRSDHFQGPTREQLDLARFRIGLKARFAGRDRVPHPEFREVIGRLLTEYGLTGWSSRRFQTAGKEPEGACAEISDYDEPTRTIWLGDQRAGTPLRWP
jgi:hypothetical protein